MSGPPWMCLELSPPATKAVYLSGLLIITHGMVEEVCDLTMAYRNYEDAGHYTYPRRRAQWRPADPHSIWIPVREGNFEMKWRRSTVGEWPEHCAMGSI